MSSNRNERQVLLSSTDSAKRAAKRPWRLTWIGIFCGIGVLALVFLFDRPASTTIEDDNAEIIELVGPSRLDPEQGESVAEMLDPRMGVELPRGGWIQVANAEGELSQQYRCEHLDPDPPELDAYWIAMQRPEVELYMSQNRLVTLIGDSALAYAPHRALEEGQFNGNVRIAMYEPVNGRPADPRTDDPALIIRTPRATFDNFLGKITCDGRIELETAREEMAGRNLQILLNDEDQRIEYLQMATLEYLVIHSPEQPATARRQRRIQAANWQAQPTIAEPDRQPVFYKLTLHEGVQIRQGSGPGARTAVGDELHVTFSLESEQLDAPTARGVDRAMIASSAPVSLPAMGSALAMGIPAQSADDDIHVTCGGGVTMVPLVDSSEFLDDPRDARLDLVGAPVIIQDPDRRLRITCPLVQYHTLDKRFDLLGDETRDVDLLTDRFRAEGSWMWAKPEAGEAGFVNPGTIEVLSASPLAKAVQQEANGTLAPTGAETLLAKDESTAVELELTWTGGIDIEFDPDDPGGGGDPNGDPALRSILFRDDVAVRSKDGTIDCGSLQMQFTRGDNGRSEPERMVALENVRARNDDQTLWTDQLIVTMDAVADEAPVAGDDLFGGRVDVKDFLATGDVQVLLADGGRAFADRLEGDARQETAILTGGNVTVARKEMLIDHGRRLVISRMEGTATWEGPGQARMLRYPLDVSADKRVDRPTVPTKPPAGSDQQAKADEAGSPVTMRARWNDEMVYDSRFNEGAGAIELKGKVAVVAEPSPIERSTMDGDSLSLQFAFPPAVAPSTTATAPSPERNDPLALDGLEGSSRVLEKLIAKGDARLEHREWLDADKNDLPRVFYIAAKHITWDDLRVRAEVIGNGDMVIREPQRDGDDPTPEGPFAGAGTSRFVWTKRLDMVRQPSSRFEISMVGDVEGLYRGATDEDIASVTAQKIEAITQRSRPSASLDDGDDVGPLDFQGDMEIEKLRAEGTVYLATRQRRADAHVVDYDTRTQIATLSARPGRKVSVVTEGSPLPVKATRMVWNMDPRVDSIQLVEPSGTGVR
ncbi:MAG: hypothetical protein MK116_07705 [Phycisphaerales bacterium]|nr:hypothetical protein [Phycisphaerales bacterium]